MMDTLLSALAYLDGIVVYSTTLQVHLTHLKSLFRKCYKGDLQLYLANQRYAEQRKCTSKSLFSKKMLNLIPLNLFKNFQFKFQKVVLQSDKFLVLVGNKEEDLYKVMSEGQTPCKGLYHKMSQLSGGPNNKTFLRELNRHCARQLFRDTQTP